MAPRSKTRPSTSSQTGPAPPTQRNRGKPSNHQSSRSNSQATTGVQYDQKATKRNDFDSPSVNPYGGKHSEKYSQYDYPTPASGSQASLSAVSHVGLSTSGKKDTTMKNAQESRVHLPTTHLENQETLLDTAETNSSTLDPQTAKAGESTFFSTLFGFGSKKVQEFVQPSEPASQKTSIGSVILQDVEFVEIEKLKETDTLIALMGPTGAGKSSFISRAANRDIGVGHNLKSETRDVKTLRIRIPGENNDIVLVDTPGFDDTHKSDYEILQIISKWLKDTGLKNVRLNGVLYLHRISDNRMAGTPLRNLELFEKICGPGWFHRVVLVTTMWDELMDTSEGERREEELRETFWAGMVSQGSRIVRYNNNHESAWNILKSLKGDLRDRREGTKHNDQKLKPRLQRETADKGRALAKTDAGNKLYEQISEQERQRAGMIRTLDKQIGRLDADDEFKNILQDQRNQLVQESDAVADDLSVLNVGVPQRLLKSWGKKAKWMFSS